MKRFDVRDFHVQALLPGASLRLENAINHPGFLITKKPVSDALKSLRFSLPVGTKVGTAANSLVSQDSQLKPKLVMFLHFTGLQMTGRPSILRRGSSHR